MAEHGKSDVLIVGAGMAGLMAAHTLAQHGLRALVIEQQPEPGGRLATRQIGPGRADSGAQFFTVRTSEFGSWVERWRDAGLIYEWSRGWSDGSLGATPSDGHPRYAVRGGMQALAAHLATDLSIRYGTLLARLTRSGQGWQAEDAHGSTYSASALLLTPPVPQALALLDASAIALTPANRAALERIEYAPCLAGLYWMGGEIRLPEPGAVQRPNAAITWIADNHCKGISPGVNLITVHAGPEYSRQIWSQPDDAVLHALAFGLEIFKDFHTAIVEARLDRWRYALPTVTYPERTLVADRLPALAFAGDAFGQPRVEGAALSGMAAGAALAAQTD